LVSGSRFPVGVMGVWVKMVPGFRLVWVRERVEWSLVFRERKTIQGMTLSHALNGNDIKVHPYSPFSQNPGSINNRHINLAVIEGQRDLGTSEDN
jgi:hypothetical protein